MSTVNIMIPSREAVEDFVAKASRMPFDMDLQIGSRDVDAKSILGIIYLGFGRVLNLKLNKENVAEAKAALADYVIA